MASGTANTLAQPVILEPPRDQTNAIGTTATFEVVATDAPPLSYQWGRYSGGVYVDILGETNNVLVLTNVTTDRPYEVVVFNPEGSVTNRATCPIDQLVRPI